VVGKINSGRESKEKRDRENQRKQKAELTGARKERRREMQTESKKGGSIIYRGKGNKETRDRENQRK
jgi:hypothetical protein